MNRLLLPLLAALALPTAVNAEIDKNTAEFCMKAADFAGCVETMQRGLPPKQVKDVDEGLRTWERDTGTIVKMRTNSVKAVQLGNPYGRYLTWLYTRGVIQGSFYNAWTGTMMQNQPAMTWSAEGDCKDYTVNWENDSAGWMNVSDPESYIGTQTIDPAREAKSVLDEFCPQMPRLVSEAKQRDLLNPKLEKRKLPLACRNGVWDKNHPKCKAPKERITSPMDMD